MRFSDRPKLYFHAGKMVSSVLLFGWQVKCPGLVVEMAFVGAIAEWFVFRQAATAQGI